MIYRDNWIIELSRHAEEQAWFRGITTDMIEATIKTGKIKWFAKNRVKFQSDYKHGKVICIGERKTTNWILILTVEGDQNENKY